MEFDTISLEVGDGMDLADIPSAVMARMAILALALANRIGRMGVKPAENDEGRPYYMLVLSFPAPDGLYSEMEIGPVLETELPAAAAIFRPETLMDFVDEEGN